MVGEHASEACAHARRSPFLLLAVLAGLFAMHGLGPHSEDHPSGHTPSVVALVAGDVAHAQHEASIPETGRPIDHADSSKDAEASPEAEDSMLGECLALLGFALALVVLALIAARRTRPVAVERRRRERVVLFGRPPDPPCLHRLSILRC